MSFLHSHILLSGGIVGTFVGNLLVNHVSSDLLKKFFQYTSLLLQFVCFYCDELLLLGCWGALASFIGIGAGSVYIPLVIFYGYSQLAAQAVSLLIISPTSALGAWHYYRKKQINLSLALSILPYAVIGVILGSLLSGSCRFPGCERPLVSSSCVA